MLPNDRSVVEGRGSLSKSKPDVAPAGMKPVQHVVHVH